MKKIISILSIVLMFSIILISAGTKVTTIPDGMTIEEFRNKVEQANSVQTLGIVYKEGSWKACSRDCSELPFLGDCSPCDYSPAEVSSNCYICEDSFGSCSEPYISGGTYCSAFGRPYNYYTKSCYCKVPTYECSGGAEPGERKCEGDEVWLCNDYGNWDYVKDCDYDCDSGICQAQQCQSHVSSECYNGDVYWYDSCGEREEIDIDCSSDEICENGECIDVCEEKYTGEKLCEGNIVKQIYQTSDCSTEWRELTICDFSCNNGECVNAQCSATSPEPGDWSDCSNGVMSRKNYRCDFTTNYEWSEYIEEQNCDCFSEGQCDDDELCINYVCEKLECSENQVVSNHECIDKKASITWLIALIIVPILFLIIIGGIIYLIIKK